jgi:asparagine synthase (glutamine-hydrolysing)
MCGIAGIINKKNKPVDQDKLIQMRDSLIHRGPDAAGIYIHNNVGLAHRRLSIIDLSEGANQPFHSPCKRYTLIFNGEIFNFQEFKNDLIYNGHKFHTESDTEVLLYLLMDYGIECLSKLIGFWAFAFYDHQENTTLLVRDRMGVKPLFYSNTTTEFAFASEPKAFFAYGIEKAVDETHIDELFFYRHVSGENTIFKGIKRILPGYYTVINSEGQITQTSRWYHLGEEAKKYPSIEKPYQWFEETFLSSVNYRMVSDVKVGTMLSGGLDSSSVIYAQSKLGYKNVSTWNIAFSDSKHDESKIAARYTKELGLDFHSFEFTRDQLALLTQEAIYNSDEPFMHVQEPHLLGLSKEAKKDVSVLLSGEAADEIFGGYVRYKVHGNQLRYKILQLLNYVPSKYIKDERWRKMKKYVYTKNQSSQIMMNANIMYIKDLEENNIGGLNLLPSYRLEIIKEAESYFPNNPLRQLMYLEQFTHIPTLNDRNDRVSMGASIENREPFEDYRIVAGAFSLPDEYFSTKGKGKQVLMNSIGKKLPEYITNHRKIGLSIPWDHIIINQPYFRDHFDKMHLSDFFKIGNMSQINVIQLKNDFKNGKKENYAFVRQIFFLSLWYDSYFTIAH